MSETRFVDRPHGARIAWASHGLSQGETILLSNSLAADWTMWFSLIERLADQYRIITYDNRGHGQSSCADQPSSMADLAADAIAVLDAAGVDKVWWIGISLGGMAGMQCALDHPERLRGLLVSNSRARIDQAGRDAWDQRVAIARSQGIGGIAQATLERWFDANARAAQPQAMVAVKAMIERTTPAGFSTCVEAIKTMQLWDRLTGLQVPVCYVAGAQDGAAPPSEMQAMAERVTGARTEVFDPCGHLSSVQRPDELVRVFKDWSKSL
jgi:3-oxoadipate enol-lactonase